MNRTTVIWASLLLIGSFIMIGGGYYFGHQKTETDERVSVDVTHSEVQSLDEATANDLQRKIDALSRQLQLTNGRLNQVKSEGVDRQEAENEEQVPLAEVPKLTKEQKQERTQQQLAFLSDKLEDESVDHAWASSIEEKINTLSLGEMMPSTTIESVECKSTFCRATFEHEVREEGRQLMFQVAKAKIPHQNGMVRILPPDEDGISQTVFYFSREGRDLPRM